jgi:glycosyltransferase involved in cell wall biosynthesis
MNLHNNIRTDSSVQAPKLSVIIPFSGCSDDVYKCLEGLRNQTYTREFEIIVVESGNNPKVKKLVNSIHNTQLISSSSLMYPGRARNSGVKSSKTNLLAFIDADCVPVPGWLSEIYSSLKNGYDIVIGPVINLYPYHPVASVDNLFLFSDFQKHRPSKNFEHFAGCNFGITRALYQKAGGFDEDMKIAEDTKFSESAIRKGKVYFNKNLVVKHSGRKDLTSFKKHHASFGFYKGYLNLKESTAENKIRKSYIYPVLLGFRRIIYISVRTLQWNPAGLLRIIFFSPFLFIGISSWIKGFRKGQTKYLSEISSQTRSTVKNKPEMYE